MNEDAGKRAFILPAGVSRRRGWVSNQIEEYAEHKRPNKRAFPPNGLVPIRRAFHVVTNRYYFVKGKPMVRVFGHPELDHPGMRWKEAFKARLRAGRQFLELTEHKYMGPRHEQG